MKTIKAEEFYKRFVDKVRENATDYDDDRPLFDLYASDMREYTKAITKKFVPQIFKELNLSPDNEYFMLDTIGWMPPEEDYDDINKKAKELKLNTRLWDLMVAVEHENDKSDWIYELIKLAHVRCPLKVIIGYTPCDRRDDDIKKAEFAYECLTKLNVFMENTDEEFLIILGNAAPKDRNSPFYDKFDFRGYILGKEIRKL